jgi:pyrroloquinoline-quinone synthase
MSIKEQIDPILEKWDLLKHPFYQAWSAGTLPVEALQLYAREYGNFIALLPRGWETLADASTAAEEREHAALWADFASALDESPAEASEPAAQELVRNAETLFGSPASALGALYAFESQQPATAKSKLEGLRAHYQLPEAAEPYFEVHSINWHEAAKIRAELERLSPAEQAEARLACEQMAESLWNALTGIYEASCRD